MFVPPFLKFSFHLTLCLYVSVHITDISDYVVMPLCRYVASVNQDFPQAFFSLLPQLKGPKTFKLAALTSIAPQEIQWKLVLIFPAIFSFFPL